MKNNKLDAIGYVDDQLVEKAEKYSAAKKKNTWAKWGALAACLCLVVAAVPLITNVLYQHQTIQSPTIDSAGIGNNEDSFELTFDEALANVTFGEYFPQVVVEGYYLESEVYVYGKECLEAIFINDKSGDLLLLRIAPKSSFDNVETDTVFYRTENQSSKASYIYVDCGEYVAFYSSKKCDLQTLDGFDKMISSAKYFN